MPGGCTNEGEGAGAKRQGGTKQEACDLIRDIVMRGRIWRGKGGSCGKGMAEYVCGSRRGAVVERMKKVVVMVVEGFFKLPE